jgi:hypothetical protein
MLNQGFNHRSPWDFDRDSSLSRVTSGNSMQPLRESSNGLTGMCKRSLSQSAAGAIQHACPMGLGRPVDSDINPILIIHHDYLLGCGLPLARRRLMPHRPCTGACGATPHWTCIKGRPRRGASPTLAARSAGRAGRSRRVAEFKRELKWTTNLAEGVAHKVHRLWDRIEHPACGLVDNASPNFLFEWGPIEKVQGRVVDDRAPTERCDAMRAATLS